MTLREVLKMIRDYEARRGKAPTALYFGCEEWHELLKEAQPLMKYDDANRAKYFRIAGVPVHKNFCDPLQKECERCQGMVKQS